MNYLIGLAGGGAVFLLSLALWSFVARRDMSAVELANEAIVAQMRRDERLSYAERIDIWLRRVGYDGPMEAAAGMVIFLALLLTLIVRGVSGTPIFISLPIGAILAVAAIYAYGALQGTRRRDTFDAQLLEYMGLVRGQLQGGAGVRVAMDRSLGGAGEPLRSEIRHALDSSLATGDLVGALKDVQQRFPSRAFDLFVAAVEINELKGGQLAPSLEQAQRTLRSAFELEAEARAEISQVKGEFWGGFVLLLGIGYLVLGRGGNLAAGLVSSTVGFIIIAVIVLNISIGIFRGQRIIANAGKERA